MREGKSTPSDLVARLLDEVTSAGQGGSPALVLVTGNLAGNAASGEYELAHQVLSTLRDQLGIDERRIVLVPGDLDVNRSKSAIYAMQCEAIHTSPMAPYWEKWQPYATMLRRFHGVELPKDQPWFLTECPDLRVVVAGLNSTMALSHLSGSPAGRLGHDQLEWFAHQLSTGGRQEWLRIGVLHHRPEGHPGLDDADAFKTLLGPHLDLIVHGQAGDPTVSPLGHTGAPVLGGHGAWQLLETQESRDGREGRVLITPGDGEPVRLPHPVARRSTVVQPSVLRRFAGRVEEVCRVRHPHADVTLVTRRGSDRVAYLRVSLDRKRGNRGPAEQQPVGVCAAAVSREDIDWFVEVRARFLTDGSDRTVELVHDGPEVNGELRTWAAGRGVDLVAFPAFQIGPELAHFSRNQFAELNANIVYRADAYVSQRYTEFLSGPAAPSPAPPADDLLTWLRQWIESERGRLVVVLGTFGHGKTFLLRELARRLSTEPSPTVPILIDLRGFEKTCSLDELVAVQLYRQGQRQFDLDMIRYLRREGRVALLFDGFDELATRVTYDRATAYLDTIVQAAEDRAKVIVTSRDQHFLTDSDVLTALGTQLGKDRRVVRLANFDDTQIVDFLTHKLGDPERAEKQFQLLHRVKDLLGLSRNPRMLGFITELGEEQLRSADQAQSRVTTADLYRQVIDRWLSFEAARLQNLSRDAPGRPELHAAVTLLALRLWDLAQDSLSLDDLNEAAQHLSRMTTTSVTPEPQESAHLLGSSTLLVRSGDERFTFVHHSVREWLIADHLAKQLRSDATPGPAGRSWSPLMIEFLCGIAGPEAMKDWAEGVLADRPAQSGTGRNALKVLRFLGVNRSASPVNMAGLDLRGEDLSGRYLAGADLSGADLTGAKLIGAELSGATLTGAALVRARLDRAVLRGADLTGADLSGARLLGADLTGAELTGARFPRAALIDTRGVDGSTLRDLDTLGAALPGGGPPEPQMLSSAVVHAVAVAAGTQMLAGAGADGVIRIWDALSGAPLRSLAGHTGPLHALAFTADGRFLASAGDDETIRIWDSTSGRTVQILTGHTGRLRALAFDPLSRFLASAGDETIRIWDTDAGRTVQTLEGHTGRIHALAWHPRGALLASSADDETVRVWDTTTGRAAHVLVGHTGTAHAIAYAPAGDHIASAGDDRSIHVWDVAGESIAHTMTGHRQWIRAIAFQPGGRELASAGDDGTVRIWDHVTGRHLHTLTGHNGTVHALAYFPDGRLLASGGDDRTVRIWDTTDRVPLKTLRADDTAAGALCFLGDPDDPWLAVGSADGGVRLWRSTAGEPTRVVCEPGVADPAVTAVAASPRGRHLATATADGHIRIWDIDSGTAVSTLSGHRGAVCRLAFSPDGRHLASAAADGVRVWGLSDGRHRIMAAFGCSAIAFGPDGRHLAGGGTDGSVRLWSLADNQRLSHPGHTSAVRAIAFSPSGDVLASADEDGVIRLRSSTGGAQSRLHGHTGAVTAITFCPTGDRLASGGADGTVRLWDSRGRQVTALDGRCGAIGSLSFSPDGRRLAGTGGDRAVRIWDAGHATTHAILVPLTGQDVAVLLPGRGHVLRGRPDGEYWYALGMCRFEPGELDPYVPECKILPPGERLW
ncbi:pentapeptide repeat-containing protein [Actinoplanes sp. NPDC023801]|uniref:WD40 domain-containing protein n=1 Tax=Actinoplanes sp. NPDC023801 TaxID=3154595 RepID=UPI0033F4B421